MPDVTVSRFNGVDRRRQQVAAAPGALWECTNAHINMGGEIEQNKKFVSTYTLPTGTGYTFSLATNGTTLYTFGSPADPGTVPAGVTYMRLQHPSTGILTKILDWTTFAEKLYVVAQYDDGSVYDFNDGTRVTDWYDGKARASFDITAGATGSVAATGSFTVTGGTNNPGTNKLSSVTINGVEVLNVAVDWATSHTATATAIAAQINLFASTPEYTAVAVGAVVTITASVTGSSPNGFVVVPTPAGNVTIGTVVNMAGGTDASRVSSVKANGVEVLNVAVNWTTDHATTAAAIAAQINSYTSSPEYTATSSGPTVYVIAPTGTTYNGYALTVTSIGSVTTSTPTAFAGGQDNSPGSQGATVLTLKDKLYTTADKNVNFSALRDATHFNSNYTGAGFFQPSTQSAGSVLVGLATHFANLVIFMKNIAQLWFVDADDSLNNQLQIIDGGGTTAPRAPIEFNRMTLFLGIPGIRALVRRSSVDNSVDLKNVGAPIDSIVQANMKTVGSTISDAAVSVVEPREGRLWFVVGGDIYVYSDYPENEIAGWSLYQPGFTITDFAVVREKLYCRAGNTVYLYGGANFDQVDTTLTTTVRIPYLDAGRPSGYKDLEGIDAAVVGTWKVEMSTDPNDPTSLETVANISESTYTANTIPAAGRTTHIAAVLTHTGGGSGATPASISEFVLHYLTDTDA